MANRPVFIPHYRAPFFRAVDVSFVYNKGLSVTQKQKNIRAIHAEFNRIFPSVAVLEISTKSMQEGGTALSAFNLKKSVPSLQQSVPVECVYQAGKVFQNGGPYTDLLMATPRDAKRDPRLKSSGALAGYEFDGKRFPLTPQYLFYNFLYISALTENPELAEIVLQYNAFTDIEFGPNSSINCQAAAAAVFVSLHKLGLLQQALTAEVFIKLLTDSEYTEQSITMEPDDVAEHFDLRASINHMPGGLPTDKFIAIGALAASSVAAPDTEEPSVKIQILSGDKIIHNRFGTGRVVKVTDSAVTVDFPEVGQKLLGRVWVEKNCEIIKE